MSYSISSLSSYLLCLLGNRVSDGGNVFGKRSTHASCGCVPTALGHRVTTALRSLTLRYLFINAPPACCTHSVQYNRQKYSPTIHTVV